MYRADPSINSFAPAELCLLAFHGCLLPALLFPPPSPLSLSASLPFLVHSASLPPLLVLSICSSLGRTSA